MSFRFISRIKPEVIWTGIAALVAICPDLHGQYDPPASYYNGTSGLTGAALQAALHGIIDNHTFIPYTSSQTDTWDALSVLDEDPANTSNVLTIYANQSIPKADRDGSSSASVVWNREHTWPQSYGFSDQASWPPYTDLHHLRASLREYNSARGNEYFDNGGTDIYPVAGSTQVNRSDANSWEVWNDRKGDVARGILYMAVRYEGDFTSEPDLVVSDTPPSTGQLRMGLLSVLLQWHESDPVDTRERKRNHLIYTLYQGNRNPFIDHPEFVALIWNPPVVPVLQITVSPASFDETAGASAATATLTRNTAIAQALTVSISVSDASEISAPATATFLAGSATTVFSLGAVDDALLDGTQSATVTVSANGWTSAQASVEVTDNEVPANPSGGAVFISEYLEGDSFNKAIELYNGTGSTVDLAAYSLRVFFNGSTSPVILGLSGTLAAGGTYVIAHNSANAAILAAASTDGNPSYSSTAVNNAMNFNGNDVVALYENGVLTDIIGGPIGTNQVWAQNVTLTRKSSISEGVATWQSNQWNSLANNTVSELGVHSVDVIPNVPEPASAASWLILSSLAALLLHIRKKA